MCQVLYYNVLFTRISKEYFFNCSNCPRDIPDDKDDLPTAAINGRVDQVLEVYGAHGAVADDPERVALGDGAEGGAHQEVLADGSNADGAERPRGDQHGVDAEGGEHGLLGGGAAAAAAIAGSAAAAAAAAPE